METDIIQQEILLLTGTTFSQKQFSERDGFADFLKGLGLGFFAFGNGFCERRIDKIIE